jgi:hypothetical protein
VGDLILATVDRGVNTPEGIAGALEVSKGLVVELLQALAVRGVLLERDGKYYRAP